MSFDRIHLDNAHPQYLYNLFRSSEGVLSSQTLINFGVPIASADVSKSIEVGTLHFGINKDAVANVTSNMYNNDVLCSNGESLLKIPAGVYKRLDLFHIIDEFDQTLHLPVYLFNVVGHKTLLHHDCLPLKLGITVNDQSLTNGSPYVAFNPLDYRMNSPHRLLLGSAANINIAMQNLSGLSDNDRVLSKVPNDPSSPGDVITFLPPILSYHTTKANYLHNIVIELLDDFHRPVHLITDFNPFIEIAVRQQL